LIQFARVTRLAHRNGDGRFRFNLTFRRGHLHAVVRAVPTRSSLLAHRTDIPGVLNPRRRGAGGLGEDVCPQAILRTTDRPSERDSSLSDSFPGVVRLPWSWPKARFSRDSEGNRVRRPSAPTSAKDEPIVVHRPGFVPLPKGHREPAVRALSSLFEVLMHRTAGSSHELDLRPESRSHASDPGSEQGPVSPKHTEGACE